MKPSTFFSKSRLAVIFLVVSILFTVFVIISRSNQSSPYSDIIFLEDRPGANGRHVTFSPVLRDDPKIVVGPIVGADYGRIHFRDLDGDGVKEAIVETQLPLIGTDEYYADTISTLRYITLSDGSHRMVPIDSKLRGEQQW
jgi:hypothetical protein